MRNIDRQVDVPAVGKLEISQMDAKSSLAAATALNDIAGPNREPAGQVICERGHVKISSEVTTLLELAATNARPARQFRDGAAFGHDFCESLWTRRSGAQPRCTDLPCNTATCRRSSGEARAACSQRSKPLSWANALREVSGRAPRCWITSAATNAARRAAVR